MKTIVGALISTFIFACSLQADERKYEFDIEYKTVNFTGNPVKAMAIGGSIPGPLIEATVGDILEVTFHNKMDVMSTVHWHGILLPPEQDGVAYLNTKPIAAGQSFTFRFEIKHSGTFWYHSHTGLQEQRGIYGPIRLLPKEKKAPVLQDKMLVWSDWTDEKPMDVLRNLKREGHYYENKKGSSQDWLKVIQNGPKAIKNRLYASWTRMGPMDLSDVGYDAYLANGALETQLAEAKAGETVRVRMINAAASSYFTVEYAGGPMTIVAIDGVDVQPIKVKKLKHAIAETYDVEVTVPATGNFELRATNIDGTGQTSAYIGHPSAPKVKAPDIPRPNLFLMDHREHMKGKETSPQPEAESKTEDAMMPMTSCLPEHAAMGHCTMVQAEGEVIEHLTTYAPLKSVTPTEFDTAMPVRKVHLKLTGNMERYIWSFNGKTLSEADRIQIKKGERVQFIFENTTMMSHPLHLHGHFFRVLNGQGAFSPLKHTVDLVSMGTITIEFEANEERDWIFHCHNLYHMKTGMSRVISYAGTSQIDDQFARNLSMDDHWFKFADLAVLSNQQFGSLWMVNNRNRVSLDWEGDYKGSAEITLQGTYFIDKFTELMAGIELERHKEQGHTVETETIGFIGFSKMLPFMLQSELRLDTKGVFRFAIGSHFNITERAAVDWHWNTDEGFDVTIDYEFSKKLSLIARRSHEYDFGVGLKFKF
ncbi:multicopper oxidase domain-containing protein [Temperatibacter marinus]|uniref:Multicopper oxidase domain-containing protein n=1 Tax=Temperatibacter marinus TaxID=1456591 RepID=A0AA52EKT2_9PROT|nr:multicopper oxidase domain-containing protein [Temperatibacter marinus]WND03836.1 multicopper oxidase domain-containing protein [Temperatibacter marinus]